MKKANWISYLIFFIGSMYLGPSSAVLLSFSTTSNNVNVGDSFEVDIVASDLSGDIISTFDLDVLYDSTVINATSVTFGTSLGDPFFFETITTDDISVPGVVDLAETSFLFDFELESLQSGSITLATITFESLAVGDSSLIFDPFDPFAVVFGGLFDPPYIYDDLVVDANSNPLVITNTVDTGNVPEPGILILMMTGLLGLGLVKRKKSC